MSIPYIAGKDWKWCLKALKNDSLMINKKLAKMVNDCGDDIPLLLANNSKIFMNMLSDIFKGTILENKIQERDYIGYHIIGDYSYFIVPVLHIGRNDRVCDEKYALVKIIENEIMEKMENQLTVKDISENIDYSLEEVMLSIIRARGNVDNFKNYIHLSFDLIKVSIKDARPTIENEIIDPTDLITKFYNQISTRYLNHNFVHLFIDRLGIKYSKTFEQLVKFDIAKDIKNGFNEKEMKFYLDNIINNKKIFIPLTLQYTITDILILVRKISKQYINSLK